MLEVVDGNYYLFFCSLLVLLKPKDSMAISPFFGVHLDELETEF